MKKKRTFRIAKRVLKITIAVILLLITVVFIYMQHPKFGKAPSGERLALVKQSPAYKNDRFQNSSATPVIAEGYSFWEELWKSVFNDYPRRKPADSIPSIKTDLLHLPPDSNIVVWFGHSSCFIQTDGKRILVDPVFSGNASPLPGSVKAFKGADIYSVADLPPIDYLLISHDHYDHLDYRTVLALKDKIKYVVCGLGLGSDFEYWGYPKEKIIEKDWYGEVMVDSGFIIHTEPARHQSARALKQDKTLWLSYVLQTPTQTIFISGDGGYDKHFAAIGNKYGPIDLAIMENGQYDSAWHYVHMLPEETLKATIDLKAKRLLPVHHSKFLLARHEWDEPLNKITRLAKANHIPVLTPLIGEAVNLNDTTQTFREWWKTVH